MSRSCMCEKWLSLAVTNAGLRSAPAVVRLVWLELVAWSAAAQPKGQIQVLSSVSQWVSTLVSGLGTDAETQAETALRQLAELGLVILSEDGRSLWLVGAQEARKRAEAAKINGSRGGRPRKGDTDESYWKRRQGTLMMPIPGGATETQETQSEPKPESSRAVVTTTPLKEESSSTARDAPAWVSLGQEVAKIARLDPVRGGFDFRPVQAWLKEWNQETILQGVRDATGRRSYDPRRVKWLGFFTPAIGEAAAQRNQAADRNNDHLAALEEDRRRSELIYGRAVA